jgi:hypothetical protein
VADGAIAGGTDAVNLVAVATAAPPPLEAVAETVLDAVEALMLALCVPRAAAGDERLTALIFWFLVC